MPDRIDLPTPFNGGLILLAVIVALVIWALATVYTHPLSHRLTDAEIATAAADGVRCHCGHDAGRHAPSCVEWGCSCRTYTASTVTTERTPS